MIPRTLARRHPQRAVVLSGLPGSGKDLWIARHGDGLAGDLARRSAPRARRQARDTTAEGHLIQDAREQARVFLRAGEPFIWNATNLSAQLRGQTLKLLADYHAHITIVAVEAPADDLYRRIATASTLCRGRRSSACSTAGRRPAARNVTPCRSGAGSVIYLTTILRPFAAARASLRMAH